MVAATEVVRAPLRGSTLTALITGDAVRGLLRDLHIHLEKPPGGILSLHHVALRLLPFIPAERLWFQMTVTAPPDHHLRPTHRDLARLTVADLLIASANVSVHRNAPHLGDGSRRLRVNMIASTPTALHPPPDPRVTATATSLAHHQPVHPPLATSPHQSVLQCPRTTVPAIRFSPRRRAHAAAMAAAADTWVTIPATILAHHHRIHAAARATGHLQSAVVLVSAGLHTTALLPVLAVLPRTTQPATAQRSMRPRPSAAPLTAPARRTRAHSASATTSPTCRPSCRAGRRRRSWWTRQRY